MSRNWCWDILIWHIFFLQTFYFYLFIFKMYKLLKRGFICRKKLTRQVYDVGLVWTCVKILSLTRTLKQGSWRPIYNWIELWNKGYFNVIKKINYINKYFPRNSNIRMIYMNLCQNTTWCIFVVYKVTKMSSALKLPRNALPFLLYAYKILRINAIIIIYK